MPDMLLSQVPPAPAPAKSGQAAARAAEAKPETESDQGFSKVLKSHMQPEKEAAQSDAETREMAVDASSSETPADAADGNPLPSGGNAATASVAVLDTLLLNADGVVQSGEVAVDAVDSAVETEALITGLPGDTLPEPLAQTQAVAAAAANTKHQQPAAADTWQMHGGPWKTGKADLPDAAQSAVAQAVRGAVAELDANAPTEPPLERFGAEVRAAVPARTPGLESMLERLTSPVAQPATPANGAAAPQGVQALVPQELASARPALPTTTVETPLRQPGWDQALSERVLWVANQKFQGAEIKLSPAHLGPIEVRVQLHQDQAQISFTAQHAPAREALEAALPRLREMFTANGYNLVDVNVSQHSFAEQQRHAQGFEGRFQGLARNEDDVESATGVPTTSGRLTGLPSSAIDLFA